MKPLIVVSSGNSEFSLFARHILENHGFAVALAIDAGTTRTRVVEGDVDAILIDGHLADALALCRWLKNDPETSRAKIVALIDQEPESDYAAFVNAGIDEGFVRPVEPRRLIRALEEMTASSLPSDGGGEGARYLTYADIEIDLYTRRVRRAGQEVRLTSIEFGLLRQFMEEPTRVFDREALIRAAWPRGTFVDRRTVNIHVGRLKRRLMAAQPANVIRTVRGSGYALDTENH